MYPYTKVHSPSIISLPLPSGSCSSIFFQFTSRADGNRSIRIYSANLQNSFHSQCPPSLVSPFHPQSLKPVPAIHPQSFANFVHSSFLPPSSPIPSPFPLFINIHTYKPPSHIYTHHHPQTYKTCIFHLH